MCFKNHRKIGKPEKNNPKIFYFSSTGALVQIQASHSANITLRLKVQRRGQLLPQALLRLQVTLSLFSRCQCLLGSSDCPSELALEKICRIFVCLPTILREGITFDILILVFIIQSSTIQYCHVQRQNCEKQCVLSDSLQESMLDTKICKI